MSQLPPPPTTPSPGSSLAPRTNTLAIISLVAGIGSFFAHIIPFVGGTLVAIVAIVTGHMARRQIRQTGEAGYGLATAGMVIGYIHIALLLALGLLVIFALIFGLTLLGIFSNSVPAPIPCGCAHP